MDIGNYPAFPCEAQGDRSVPQEHDYIQTGIYTSKFPGLTIRDWFAGQALPVAARDVIDFASTSKRKGHELPALMADAAYQIADAMLARRKQEQG